MARLLGLQNLAEQAQATNSEDSLQISLDPTAIPHMHFSTVMSPNETSTSQVATSLHTPQASVTSLLDDSSGSQPRVPDLAQVLASLQTTGDLGSLLQQQPSLLTELSTIAGGDVSTNPESLRFQYDGDSSQTVNSPSKSAQGGAKPVVYKEQDRFLPIHNVSRIMRNAISKSGKVSKEAKECIQECVSEFISFITSEASDKCIQEKRKTITGDDILFAMATLGFDNHIEPLRIYLQKYREFTKADKGASPSQNTTETATSSVVARAIPMNELRQVMASVPQTSTNQTQRVSTNSAPSTNTSTQLDTTQPSTQAASSSLSV